MKADKIRDLDRAELDKQLSDMREQTFRLQFQMRMGQMDPLKKYRQLRKDRARILTILRERELAGETAPAPPVAATAKKKKGK
jgi:large subunit ribosomal protein L29